MLGRKKTPNSTQYGKDRTFDYGTKEGRIATAQWLFENAKIYRSPQEQLWIKYNDYYNFIHDVTDEVRGFCEENGINWLPSVVADAFNMVESQIDPIVPEPEFKGRDDDLDSEKAKKREFAVKYICQKNRLSDMNTSNEKRLKKLGDAFFKAYWDADMDCGPYEGDIRIKDIPVECIYPDPTAGNEGIQAGQFVDYVYRVHKVKFWQMFSSELTKMGLTLDDIVSSQYSQKGCIFDLVSNLSEDDDTVQILEHWFRQPVDTKDATAGSVACSIQAGGYEVKYIPNYWQKTGRQNQLFPFVHYWCVRDENDFYNKSELFPIMSFIDSADRALANAEINNAFTSNDLVLVEEDALIDGEELRNAPGAVINLRKNGAPKVKRLGGLNSGNNSIPMIQWLQGEMQKANRNYETNQGKESARVTTASGLAQLRSDADTQLKIKKADRNAGFERLYELIDWLCLEFYDDNRVIFLGGEKEGEEPYVDKFNADNFAITKPALYDMQTDQKVRDEYKYYPIVDVTINAGDGIIRSKITTLDILGKLASVPVTPDNYKMLEAQLEILDIPQKQEIIQMWEDRFGNNIPPQVIELLKNNPQLIETIMAIANNEPSVGAGTETQEPIINREDMEGFGSFGSSGLLEGDY